MVSFGNPSLQHAFDEEQARDLFRRLPVLVLNRYILGASTDSSLVDEPKAPTSRLTYESLLSDLPGDLGAKASQRETSSLSELLTLWEASLVHPCGRLDLPLRGEPTRDPGTTFAYYTWWKEHILPRFEGVVEKRRIMTVIVPIRADEGRKANKKRAPLATLNGASALKEKLRVEAQPASHPSPPTFLPPILETEPGHSLLPQTSCPPVLEMKPPEPEPPIELYKYDTDSPEDIEVAEAPAATSSMGPILEVAPASTQLEASPPVREIKPIVQEAATLPLPAPPVPASVATPLVTPSQQLQSNFWGVVLQFWNDRIVPLLCPLMRSSSSVICRKLVRT
ncbi:hypothetical protein H6P81_010581 [Aristolochia fimbriata]|uniref:Histone acetyltransferase n=1 Tax=Aristolochia fimbriata TaxID=158543 RepID=A0AAV7ESK5_ARIFI|nr:hypothetical protein H6P81_010581 [Aristolochia fimbriata]